MSSKLKIQLEQMEETYEAYSKEFSRDGSITPDESAVLKRVSAKLAQLRKEIDGQERKHEAKADAASGEASVTLGEPSIGKQVALGKIHFGGKLRGTMWGLTDKDGAVVRSGIGLMKDLARMNDLGERALKAIDGLESLDATWRAKFDIAHKATQRGEVDLKKLEQAIPAMKKRSKRDGDFFNDVDGYLVAMEKTEDVIRRIPKAQKDFERFSHELNKAVFELEFAEAETKYNVTKDKLDQLKADMKQAQGIFGSVMGIAIQIAKQDWEGLATKAVAFVGEKTIEGFYTLEMDELRSELSAAKSEMTRLKTAGLVSGIEAARAGLESAAIGLQVVQREFKTALDQLVRKQANARNELEESSSTAIAGRMIEQRTQQRSLVATARSTCERYLGDSAGLLKSVALISREYSQVGSFLEAAAKVDPAFRSGTPYVKMFELSARSNVVSLDHWGNWVEGVQDKCRQAQQWLAVQGPKGPMGPYDRAIERVKQGLK